MDVWAIDGSNYGPPQPTSGPAVCPRVMTPPNCGHAESVEHTQGNETAAEKRFKFHCHHRRPKHGKVYVGTLPSLTFTPAPRVASSTFRLIFYSLSGARVSSLRFSGLTLFLSGLPRIPFHQTLSPHLSPLESSTTPPLFEGASRTAGCVTSPFVIPVPPPPSGIHPVNNLVRSAMVTVLQCTQIRGVDLQFQSRLPFSFP